MSPAEVTRLRDLHRGHKGGILSPTDRGAYDELRDAFLSTMVRAQRLVVKPGEAFRQHVRVAAAMQVTVTAAAREHRTATLDIGARGFSAVVGAQISVGAICEFVLLPGREPIRGRCRVVSSLRHAAGLSSYRTSFAVESLGDRERERMEDLVLEAALAAFGR